MNASPRDVTRLELLMFVVFLSLGIALLPLVGGSVLWTRPLWLDELCCVSFVVADASSPAQIISTIARARGDYAPPLLHLMVWPIARLAGGPTPVLLHTISLVCVSFALLLVYAAMRRRFDRTPSAAATIAVASHSLVLYHAFEGRFYGPWLLFAAGHAWSLGISAPRRRAFAQALFSIFLATIHWFGILSLGLLCLGAVAAHGRRWRDGLRLIAPSAAGIVALLAFIPMLLAQRAHSAPYLWVLNLSLDQVREMVALFWISTATIVAVAVLLIGALGAPGQRLSSIEFFRTPGLAALSALVLMPVALMVVSLLVQPSMVPRYAIVAALAWAPLVAAATALTRVARGAVLWFTVGLLVLAVQRSIADRREFADLVAAQSSAFQQAKAAQTPIVFASLHTIYPVAGPERSPHSLARYLDLPESAIDSLFSTDGMAPIRRKVRLERDYARSHSDAFGFPILASQAQLDTTRRFVLLARDASLPGGYKDAKRYGRVLFPRHRVTRINQFLSLFERVN